MDATAAFNLLKIAPNASADEIRAAYRRAVREYLDAGAIEEETIANLNAARDIALGGRSAAGALAPYANGGLPATAVLAGGREVVAYERARDATEAVVARIVRVHVSRLRHARNRAAGAATLSGIVAALPTLARQLSSPTQSFGIVWRYLHTWSLTLACLAFFFVVWSAGAARRAHVNERAIEDLQDTFEDRASFVAVLQELRMLEPASDAPDRESDSWDTQRIEAHVGAWLRKPRIRPRGLMPYSVRLMLARLAGAGVPSRTERPASEAAFYLGPDDFTRLLLRKGIETGLIREVEHWTDHALTTTYIVNIGARGSDPVATTPGVA